jgi:hypothetical protein
LELDIHTLDDGARWVKFIERVVASSESRETWVPV